MGWWDTILGWFGRAPSAAPSARDALREIRADRGTENPEWTRLNGRFATLVLGEADRQRLWQRAHRGSPDAARLLSGITAPTPAEVARLEELVRELEAGR